MKRIIIPIIIVLLSITSLLAQSVTITNVSTSPNPFSPDGDFQRDNVTINYYLFFPSNLTSPQVEIIIYQNNISNVIYNTTVDVTNGLNSFIWNGQNNLSNTVPDGKYGFKIIFNNAGYQASYIQNNGLIVRTQYPEIEIVSSTPNPFSPNEDGFQDVHAVKLLVKNVPIHYIGTVKIVFTDTLRANFIDGPYSIPHSDGAYLFLNRPLYYRNQIDVSPDVKYDFTIGGTNSFTLPITLGNDLYKVGTNYSPYYSVSPSVAVDPAETYIGTDYLAVYAVSGNLSFNLYNNDGSIFSLNDCYNSFFGSFNDNPLDLTNIDPAPGRFYHFNIGSTEGQFPGQVIEDGRYIYRVSVSNEVELATQMSGEFLVNNNPIMVNATINPNKISPQKVDGVFDQTVIQYTPSEDAFITVKIWDENNNLVKTLSQNQLSIMDIGNYVLWDGKNESGQIVSLNNENIYRVEITAVDRFINNDVASLNQSILVDNKAPDAPFLYQTEPDSLNSSSIVVSGLTDQINCQIILLQNGVDKGVVGTTPQYPGYFQFPVNLEEGIDNITIRLRDSVYNLGTPSNTIHYLLDSQAPVITNPQPVQNSVFTTLPITASALVTDNGVGVKQVRFGFSFNDNPVLNWVTGLSVGNDIFTASIPVNVSVSQLNIKMFIEASDSLNNIVQTSEGISFSYFRPSATNPPHFSASYPVHNSNIKLLNQNNLTVSINSENPLILNPDSTYIKLYNLTSGDSLYHNFGGLISYSSNYNNYQVNLLLDNPLSQTGSDDARYKMTYTIRNNISQILTGEIFFNYDTTKPSVNQLSFNNNQTLQLAGSYNYFTHNINQITMNLDDNLSGINYALNMTNIVLLNAQGLIVNGSRRVDEFNHNVTWTLSDSITITTPRNYTISVMTTDNAGNTRIDNTVFTLLTPQAPTITNHYPINNSILKTLNNNKITKTIIDTNGFGLDPNTTNIILSKGSIIYSNGVNASQNLIHNSNGSYELNLTLNDPLASDGSNDGEYTVTTNVQDLLNQSIPVNITTFKYDTTAPLFTNPRVGGVDNAVPWERILTNQLSLNHNINMVKIAITDLTSGLDLNSANTYIKLYNATGTLVEGSLSYSNGDLIWTLAQSIPQTQEENGSYTVSFSAVDLAGNVKNGSLTFILQNTGFIQAPVFESSYPAQNQSVNSILSNTVKVNIQTDYPIIQNPNQSFIRLVHVPSGNVIENGIGGTMSYLIDQNQTQLSLILNNALYADGSDDALYRIEYQISNTLNQIINGSVNFYYDTTVPVIDSLKINQNDLLNVNNNYFYSHQIDSVSVFLSDNLSGINVASNLTKIALYNSATNQVINGNRFYNPTSRCLSWRLTSPILLNAINTGNYRIGVFVTDNAGNTININYPFQLIIPSAPQISQHTPIGNSYISQLVSNKITKKVYDTNSFGLDRTNSSIILHGPNNVVYQKDQNASLTFTNLENNFHQVNLILDNTLPNDGSVDGLYSVQSIIVDTLGQSISNTMSFTYDSQSPSLSNPLIGNNLNQPWTSPFINNMSITSSVQFVSVDLFDLTTQIDTSSSNTYIKIYNSNDQLLQGSRSINNNTYKWTLNTPISNIGLMDGSYYCAYSATDLAGNQLSGRLNFRVNNPYSPLISLVYPSNSNSPIINSLNNNTISVDFHDERLINLTDFDITYIKLITPSNSTIAHGSGAIQEIVDLGGFNYRLLLHLSQPLTINGTYTVQIRIQNNQNYYTVENDNFIFDNVAPTIQSIKAGLINNTESIISDNDHIYHGVSYIKVLLNDVTSGVDYLPQNTNLSVSTNNGVIPGIMEFNSIENYLKYTFNTPITTLDVNVSITTHIKDLANNSFTNQTSFVINALQANIISITPSNNSYINSDLNQIKLVVEYPQNVVINQQLTYISLIHPDGTNIHPGQGGSMSFTQNQNQYEIIFNLNQPLSANGQDDGEYQIYALLVTDNFQEGPINFSFTYDRLAPYFQNLRINNETIVSNRVSKLKVKKFSKSRNELIINHVINSVKVNYYDLTSLVNLAPNETTISLIAPNGVLVPGHRYVENDTVKYVLTTPLPVDGSKDGVYTIALKATDYASNQYTNSYSFTLMSNITPTLLTFTPENVLNHYTNQFSPPTITGEFLNTIPVVQNPYATYITMTYPNGEVASYAHGALMNYSINQNNLKVTFNLFAPLSTTGENDGEYSVRFHATNIYGAEYDTTMPIIFDVTNPSFNSLKVSDSSQFTSISENSIVTNSLNSIQAILTDQTSGIHYTPNLSYVSLLDRNQNLIPGFSEYINISGVDITQWTCTNPVPNDGSADGIYYAKLKITDKAGNSIEKTIPFNFISILVPQNVNAFTDALYKTHISWTLPQTSKKVIKSKGVQGYKIFRKYNNGEYIEIANTLIPYYLDNLQQQPDGNYQYMIKALYSVTGNTQVIESDPAYSNIFEVKRFVPVTFNLTLSDNHQPSGILLSLLGHDGLYNQEFNIISSLSGIVNLPSVFMEDYILTLSKQGYQTLIDTLSISLQSTQFNYTLLANSSVLNGTPTNYALYQNFPNPFNPTTEIRFALKNKSKVDLSIYNVKGQLIRRFREPDLNSGYHKITWDGKDRNAQKVTSGIYFYVIDVKNDQESYKDVKKMIMMK